MTFNEQRAHDLALLATKSFIEQDFKNSRETGELSQENLYYKVYKRYYDKYLHSFNEDYPSRKQ